MKPAASLPDEPHSDLLGVPGLGTVRRRLLAEAGIATRAALAQASPEQIVSLTGMPRSAADTALAAVTAACPPAPAGTLWVGGVNAPEGEPLATAHIREVSPLANDGHSLAGAGGQLSADEQIAAGDTPDALGDDAPQTTRLERAALRAQTAIADASRHAKPASKLGETLLRFARLADELPSRVSPSTGTAVVKRLAVRLETISERLETVGGAKPRTEPLSEKRTKRLQQRLKRTRDSIKRTLKRGDTKLRKPAASPAATT